MDEITDQIQPVSHPMPLTCALRAGAGSGRRPGS